MAAEAQLDIVLTNVHGLHMKTAGLVAQMANGFDAEVTVRHGEKTTDARSIIGLVSLGAAKGSTLKIIARGDGSAEVVEAVRNAFETTFPESDLDDAGYY